MGTCIQYMTAALLLMAMPAAVPDAQAGVDAKRKPSSTYKMSLEDAIQMGVRNATAVLKGGNSVESAGATVLQAYGHFLPNLNATASAQSFSGRYVLATSNLFRIYGVTSSLSYNLSSTLNIFNGLADVSSLSAAIARKDASEFSLERAKQQIAIDVTQSYLQVILDRRIEEIAKGNIALSKDILSYLESKKSVGAATQIDIARQKAQLANDELAVSRATAKAQNDLLSLLDKLRFNVRNECILVEPKIDLPEPGDTLPSADDLMGEAITERLDLAASESLLKATEAEVRFNRSAYFPKLDFSLTYGASSLVAHKLLVNDTNIVTESETRNQPSLLNQLPVQTQTTLLLTLTWNIFDRLQTKTKVQIADLAKDNAELDLQDMQNRVRVDVKHALNDYAAALEELTASKTSLDASQKVFGEVKGRYKVGAASFIDLNTAQLALTQAKVNWAQAVVDYRLKKDVIAYSVGGETRLRKAKN